MNISLKSTCCSLKEWMVPPVLVPLALILLIAIWVVLRPHTG
jgi:hypothetical protein